MSCQKKPKVLKYGNQGADYHSKLKRKYEDILFGLDDQEEDILKYLVS